MSVVHSCKLTALNKVCKSIKFVTIINLWHFILTQEPFERLDKAYCDSLEKAQLLELQQKFKRIESPIDFLIALHNFIAVFVSHRSPTEDCKPKWRFVMNLYTLILC